MSSNFWQMKKQEAQFKHGNTRISKIEAYIRVWQSRCYSDGIPDAVPDGIAKSMRVPSYKAIAIAILKNDHALSSIGFSGKMSEYYGMIKQHEKTISSQEELF